MLTVPLLEGHLTSPNCIERGFFRSLPPRSVIIIAEVWPTWLVICPSLNLACTAVYCSSSPSRQLWTPFLGNTCWYSTSALAAESFASVDLVLLNGSPAWLPPWCSLIPSTLPVISVLDFSPTPPSRSFCNLSWVKLFHQHAGGVTDGFWFFGSSVRLPSSTYTPSYPRRLTTLLTSTCSSYRPAIAPPTVDSTFDTPVVIPGSKLLHPGGLLPLTRCSTVLVCCPSVFTPTRWCSRTLSVRELCAAFDLPESFSVATADGFTGVSRNLPFLRCAPSKLLRRFLFDLVFHEDSGGVSPAKAQSPITESVGDIDVGEIDSSITVYDESIRFRLASWLVGRYLQRKRWKAQFWFSCRHDVPQLTSRDLWATIAYRNGQYEWKHEADSTVSLMNYQSWRGRFLRNINAQRDVLVLRSALLERRPIYWEAHKHFGEILSEDQSHRARMKKEITPPGRDPWLALLLPSDEDAPQAARQKAAKNDDAAVPTELWDKQLWCSPLFSSLTWKRAIGYITSYAKHPLEVIRNNFLLPYWRKGVWKSWNDYFKSRRQDASYDDKESELDKAGARMCLHYASRATWWDWPGGSKLFFWRWPSDSRGFARDGMRSWIRGDLPSYKVPQRYESDDAIRAQMTEKLQNVFDKGYITWGDVKSLTSYFSVPKGEGDIRMVYDGTKCGLNDVLWVPSFALPDVDTLLSIVDESSWMGDIDIGEMFLNFPLDVHIQAYCGVDVKPYLTSILSWIMWVRCAMGLKPSPYIAIRFMLFASEVIRGDHRDSTNALRYDKIRLNLPGHVNYDPTVPWVSKVICNPGDKLAADFVGYVDDLRPVGSSELECNQCARQISCVLGYLGIQDASRKRVGASKNAGVWAGSVVFANDTGVGVNCTQEKWDKTKTILSAIRTDMKLSDVLDHKTLEKQRGFLIYVTRTYPSMVPYLKGIHLTLDSWRSGRDSDGWKFTMAELRQHFDDDAPPCYVPKEAPSQVYPASRLETDIETLLDMTSASSPPKRFVRSKVILSACYGFGDASGSGFGSAVQGHGGLWYRHGIWGTDTNKLSSNYRELRNLVETIEEGVANGSLNGAELFLFTDNTVAEAAFYKGNTGSSKFLFDLIVRLRRLEMSGSMRFWVIHVSGKRMIEQGVDGLSRGNLIEGVMEGKPMLAYIPLALTCFESTSDLLETWIRSWYHSNPVFLDEQDWFVAGHGITGGSKNADGIWMPTTRRTGHFVWAPPPAAGRSAIDQLAISRHKRPNLTHMFICPRLFTSLWRKRLYKIADCVINIPAGARPFWPSSKHEPLIIGLLLPFSSVSPWQHRRSPPVLELERKLRQVWHQPQCDERVVLRQFLKL